MVSEMSENYEKLLVKSLREKNLDKISSNQSKKSILDYDENTWNRLLNSQDDSLMRDAIDDLLGYAKHPIIDTKRLNELREKTINASQVVENKLTHHSNEKHLLGFQHSSSKSMTENETNPAYKEPLSDERTMSLVNDQKGWTFSPIKKNQLDNSEMSTVNKYNDASPSRSNDNSAAGRLYFNKNKFNIFIF